MCIRDRIGSQRLATRSQYETFLVTRAVLTETVLARRGDHAPYRRAFRDIGAFGLVAGLRFPGKARNAQGVRRILARQEATIGQRALQMIMAHIIGAPLEQRDLDRRTQRLAHCRDAVSYTHLDVYKRQETS